MISNWTAEQSIEAFKRDCTSCYDRKARNKESVMAEFQVSADELNAMLGSRTCKLEETESYQSERGTVHVLECSECGHECEHVNGDYEYCPHCLSRNTLF